MRILIANLSRHVVGGAEKYLQIVIPGLMEHGHSVGVLYELPVDPDTPCIDSKEIRLPSWCSAELGVAEAMRSVDHWEPDIVYSHGLEDSQLENALLDRFPVVLFAHTYSGTCVSGRKCHAWPRLKPCDRRLGAGCLVQYFPRRCGGIHPVTMWKMFQRQTERNARFARFRTILVASQHMYREYEKNGVTAERLRVMRLPLTSAISAVAERPAPARNRILFLGRLMDVKGVHYLIPAVAKASRTLGRPLMLTIAGEGPERTRLQELTSHCEMNVEFTGWVNEEQKLQLMQAADLLVVPSLWPEPFGLVGIEAGNVGLPAAAYAVGGIPDWLIAGESGELASGDPPTVEGLAAALVRALADARHYDQLRRGARRMAQRFSLENHLAELEEVLNTASRSAREPDLVGSAQQTEFLART